MSAYPTETTCLILARGGSKRVPRKNVHKLNGKPLVCYTFEAAIASDCFAEVVISTDDPEVEALARNYGITIDHRPAELAADTARAVEVVDEYLKRDPSRNRKHVAMLLPTCPFRNADDVRAAFDIYFRHKGKLPLMAVTQYDFPPQLALTAGTGDKALMREPEAYVFSTRSQNIQPLYHPNGAIYISSSENFIERHTFFQEEMLTYIMPAERSFDIDYPYQMRIAEIMAKEFTEGTLA